MNSKHIPESIIKIIDYTRKDLDEFVDDLRNDTSIESKSNARLLLDYPTVYVVHDNSAKSDNSDDCFTVYIGETTDIKNRTIQHLETDPLTREDWKLLSESTSAEMYVISNEFFNKSLTMDIENQLMLYLTGAPNVQNLNNRRTNPQKRYFTDHYFREIFTGIWNQLHEDNEDLFPEEIAVRDSALFKASPFHKLTTEQLDAKRTILNTVIDALETGKENQLIIVNGEAGAGKTVLISSLFYDLFQDTPLSDTTRDLSGTDAHLLVNHAEQLTVYHEIAKKLGLLRSDPNRVSLPTSFINRRPANDMVDVTLVDEAHLLLTQGNQGYRGKNHLEDILERSRVVIAVYDENQVMATSQYWDPVRKAQLFGRASAQVELKNQMRISASSETVAWIRTFIDDGIIDPLPLDDRGLDTENYEVRAFSSADIMYEAIQDRASIAETELSRMIATYDWKYSSASKPKGPNSPENWMVDLGSIKLPWNRQLPLEKDGDKSLSWAEQSHTIGEVGSTFTIQGFDLNYAGVVLGPSITYREGRIRIDPSKSFNKKSTRRRTTENGEKISLAEDLIKNELNVLMTRGANGLYIYAVDQPLRAKLMEVLS